jgi:hypothetical protein
MDQAGMKLIHRLDEWPGGQYCLVFQKLESKPAGMS